ncbi:acyl-CoA thioesterase [Phaeacidiphilus oryzae]|uniref:acyl-CoA thioesterase n=1 Tax=Phaeacidiphilus oryzae TaxID=348818 RepID=UPI0007C67038|nr:acyl-CoA thioesterase II [Phaeacidiphilus oryzae]
MTIQPPQPTRPPTETGSETSSPPPSLADLLTLERIGEGAFRSGRHPGRGPRMFGGELAGQALVAAGRTAPADRPVHSAHAYFLRAGDPDTPVEFEVRPVRDGGSFSLRQVTARQHGRAVFELVASFHRLESGPAHQVPKLRAPDPESLPSAPANLEGATPAERAWLNRIRVERNMDFRFPESLPPFSLPERGESTRQRTWMRTVSALPPLAEDPVLHAGAVMYVSDLLLLPTALGPHGSAFAHTDTMLASLDHAVWFHAGYPMDGWVLYEQESAWADAGRALCTGRMLGQDGRLVASVAQEGLVRLRS